MKDTYHQDIYTSIVIPATVRRIDSYAFFYRNNYSRIRSIYLCEGVQSVGNYALYQSDIQADTVYLTLPNSLQEFGRDEEQLWNSRYIHVFAAENSVGAEYASRAAATFHNNHAADGTITGNYANMDFRIQNGEVTLWYARFGQGSSISLPKVMALHRRGSISHTGWSFDWNNPSMNYL